MNNLNLTQASPGHSYTPLPFLLTPCYFVCLYACIYVNVFMFVYKMYFISLQVMQDHNWLHMPYNLCSWAIPDSAFQFVTTSRLRPVPSSCLNHSGNVWKLCICTGLWCVYVYVTEPASTGNLS